MVRPGFVCLLAALALAGCGRIERTSQCIQLVTTVNAALDEIAARQDAGTGGAEAERAIAKRYELLAVDLETYTFESPGLAKAVLEYRDLVRETSRLVGRVADARDRGDLAGVAMIKRELANLGRREKMLAMRIDSSCQSP